MRDDLMRDERGTTTLWVLGLCLCLLFLGGAVLDLWRVVEERRSLAAMADAAAAAGTSGLDEDALRRGETTLDPVAAERLARDQLRREGDRADIADAWVDATETTVRVEVVGTVDFSLLGIFVGGEPIEVHARAEAEPRRIP